MFPSSNGNGTISVGFFLQRNLDFLQSKFHLGYSSIHQLGFKLGQIGLELVRGVVRLRWAMEKNGLITDMIIDLVKNLNSLCCFRMTSAQLKSLPVQFHYEELSRFLTVKAIYQYLLTILINRVLIP